MMTIVSKDFFWQSIEHWRRQDLDGTALRFPGENEQSVSFRELDELTDRLAESFLSLGVGRGD